MAISFVYGHINAQSKGGIEQYNCFNNAGANENFFYNWSELGYTIRKWIYAGFTMQQTVAGSGNQTEKGIIIGFIIKKFTIPVYFFNPMKPDKYFILGINWEWDKH